MRLGKLGKFTDSDISTLFADGNPRYVAGMSGVELVWCLLDIRCGAGNKPIEVAFSPEYWLGWCLAWYQWSSNIAFSDIKIPMDDLLVRYYPLHEAPIEKFGEILDEMRANVENIS